MDPVPFTKPTRPIKVRYVKEAFRLLKQTHITVDSEDVDLFYADESGEEEVGGGGGDGGDGCCGGCGEPLSMRPGGTSYDELLPGPPRRSRHACEHGPVAPRANAQRPPPPSIRNGLPHPSSYPYRMYYKKEFRP